MEAASFESATRLLATLSEFQPELTKNEEGRFFVSVEVDGDEHVVGVIDTIQSHLAGRVQDDLVSSMSVALDDRRYTVHDR
jgi:hypothetical protein